LSGLQIQDVIVEEEVDIGDKDAENKKDAEGEGAWSRIVKKEEVKPTPAPVAEPTSEDAHKPEESVTPNLAEEKTTEEPAVVETNPEEPSESKPNKYVPPSKRGMQPSAGSDPSSGSGPGAGTRSNPPLSSGAYVPPSRRGLSSSTSSGYSSGMSYLLRVM